MAGEWNLTKTELQLKMDVKWVELHAAKRLFVLACDDVSKAHHLRTVEALEAQHQEFWNMLKDGDYEPDILPDLGE